MSRGARAAEELGRGRVVARDEPRHDARRRQERTHRREQVHAVELRHDSDAGQRRTEGDARSGQEGQLKVTTVSALLPLMLDNISQPQVDRLISGYLTNPAEFWDKYPVPAEPLSSPKRRKLQIWRGQQTWVYTNWFIVKGLRKQAQRFPEQRSNYNSIADAIIDKTCQMVEQEGFREYYDSGTGKGCRALNFGWSALVMDMVYNR